MVFAELPFMSEPNPDNAIQLIGGTGGPGNQPQTANATPLGPRPPGNGRQQNLNGGAWPAPAPASGTMGGNGSAPFPRGPAPPSKGGGKRDPRKRWCIFRDAQIEIYNKTCFFFFGVRKFFLLSYSWKSELHWMVQEFRIVPPDNVYVNKHRYLNNSLNE